MIKSTIYGLAILVLIPAVAFSASGLAPKPTQPSTSAYGDSQASRLTGATLLISQGRFKEAYHILSKLSVMPSDEADRQNLLGFSARKTGELSKAKDHYEKALEMDPGHLGALEYQGKLFVMLGDLNNANLNLKKLKGKCFLICPKEYNQLLKTIEQK